MILLNEDYFGRLAKKKLIRMLVHVFTRLIMKFSRKVPLLNDVLMKGPNMLNDLFGVQLRFLSYPVPLGDIKKMYHSIKTTEVERHLPRVLWRNLEKTENVKTYGIKTVTFGDRPAAVIATVAIQNPANAFGYLNQKAAAKIMKDSYVNDIVTGEEDMESMISLKKWNRANSCARGI